MAMNRMLVVGGQGFIGRPLCRIAQMRGFSVTSLSLHSPISPLEGGTYIVGNLSDRESIKQVLAGKKANLCYLIQHVAKRRNIGLQSHIRFLWCFEGVQNL